MRAVGRLGGAKRWMPHTLGHSETPEERVSDPGLAKDARRASADGTSKAVVDVELLASEALIRSHQTGLARRISGLPALAVVTL